MPNSYLLYTDWILRGSLRAVYSKTLIPWAFEDFMVLYLKGFLFKNYIKGKGTRKKNAQITVRACTFFCANTAPVHNNM